jgi:hypothetical protein
MEEVPEKSRLRSAPISVTLTRLEISCPSERTRTPYSSQRRKIMKNSRSLSLILVVMTCAAVLGLNAPRAASGAPGDDKMKAEEVVAKHLESIGAAETRDSITSRVIVGAATFSFRARGVGQTAGRAVMASQGVSSLIGMEFPGADYPYERLGFDGRKFTAGYVRPGVRSIFGEFIHSHPEIYKEGLMGGTLSQAWPLLNLSTRNAKLEYAGGGKVNGREAHVLRYSPKGGTDFQIKLYFDAATFQHVRTEYEQSVSAGIGRTDKESAGLKGSTYKIVEEFSDFKKESGLMLPHTYKLRYTTDDANGVKQFDWELTLAQFAFNRKIPAESFDVEAFKAGS